MDILNELIRERDRIDAAIQALGGTGTGKRRGRPVGRPAGKTAAVAGRKPRRKLSAAARRKISEAAKARWVKAKKAGKNTL